MEGKLKNPLQAAADLHNEALLALHDKNRTMENSELCQKIMKAAESKGGKMFSYLSLYSTIGSVAIMPMSMMIPNWLVLLPLIIREKKKQQEKERLIQEILKRHEEVLRELEQEKLASKARKNYLKQLLKWMENTRVELEKA